MKFREETGEERKTKWVKAEIKGKVFVKDCLGFQEEEALGKGRSTTQ